MDSRAGLCTGCARTLDEIVRWGAADAAERARAWAELPARAARLGLRLRRLEWRGAEVLDAVARRLAAGWTLRAGPPGAAVEVAGPVHEAIRSDLELKLRTADAAIRLEAPHWLSVFEIAQADGTPRLVLAVPRGRAGAAGAARSQGRHAVEGPCLLAEADAPAPSGDAPAPSGDAPAPGGDAPALPKSWVAVAALAPG